LTSEQSRQRNIALHLIAAIAAICTVSTVMMFTPGSTVNHQGTYGVQVLAAIFAFMVLSLRALPLAVAFIAGQTITVATLYAFTLPHDPGLWPLLAVSAASAAGLFGYTFFPTFASLCERHF
jgi:hypothetical protein